MYKHVSLLLLISFISVSAFSKKYVAVSYKEFQLLPTLQAGDTVMLKNGIWNNAELKVDAFGTQKQPVVVMAETSGKVSLQGQSSLNISGTYIHISGLVFENGYSTSTAVISFRDSNGKLASHCRVTNCAIRNFSKPERFKQDDWIFMAGRYNRFDHNYLEGKLNAGVTLVVDLSDTLSQKNFHQIDHNYFAPRVRLGSNGGESIRVGFSTYSLKSSNTIIEDNFFDRCSGEVEIVSIKSCDNIIRRNKFFECEGSVVLRHGNNNVVESNYFDGNNKPFTGGVRIVNAGQRVYNNYFKGLRGTAFRAPVSVMNGVPNSLINRYYRVDDAIIAFNTFKDCAPIELCTGSDNERTDVPVNTLFAYNTFQNSGVDSLLLILDNISGIRFDQNYTNSNKIRQKGFICTSNPVTDARLQNRDSRVGFIASDFAGTSRQEKSVPGAIAGDISKAFDRMFSTKYGPDYSLKSTGIVQAKPKQTYKYAGHNPVEIQQLIDKANGGDEIVLSDTGLYFFEKPLSIRKKITIRSADLKRKPIFMARGNKMVSAFISVENGGSLNVENLIFDGENAGIEGIASAISIGELPIVEHFNVLINGCEFYNYNEGSYFPIKAGKGSYIDTFAVKNCIFGSLTGDAIYLAAEKDDKGTYNAENVFVENCLFYKVRGIAINVYRGGNDESTLGPFVNINHCTFDQVNNAERGSVIRLPGAQVATVKNSCFSNSGRGGRSILFDESRFNDCKVDYLNLSNSGRIESFYGNVAGKAVYNYNPMYASPALSNYQLQDNSPLKGKADDGKDIGCVWVNGKLK